MEDKARTLLPTSTKPLTRLGKKVLRDKDRKRNGKPHKKRVAILIHPKIKAFLGWRTEAEPWTYQTVNKYVDWCHINKLFPFWRHKEHRTQSKANLAYSKNEDFTQRCLEVWMAIYLEPKVYRNDNFCFCLVQMVYAEIILKKKVDWTTLPELREGVHPDEVTIPSSDIPIDVKKVLTSVKLGKLVTPDDDVVWSPPSSSDERTHEYDGYSFHSDDEDVVMEEEKKALEVEYERKGKRKVEDLQTPLNLEKQGTEHGEPMEVDPVLEDPYRSGSGSDSEDDEDTLAAKIQTAREALHQVTKEIRISKETGHSKEDYRQYVDGLKQQLDKTNTAIKEQITFFNESKKIRDFYIRKWESGKVHVMDEYVVYQKKLELLQRERHRLKSERQALDMQINTKEQEYFTAAMEHAPELNVLAMSPDYGSTPAEVATLRKLVKLQEKKTTLLFKDFDRLNCITTFNTACMRWHQAIKNATRVELEQLGPEPQESDFLDNSGS
jgi:hypothetical protein